MIQTLILPGLWSSNADHWQSHWERMDPSCTRVEQKEWASPDCADWAAGIDAAIARAPGRVVLVAHSAACIAVAFWARSASPAQRARVLGAMLVAPSDPDGPAYPEGPTGFSPVPLEPLPFPSLLVCSSNDEYVTPARAREYAVAWTSEFVDVGPAGHINSAGGMGPWPEGYALLERLRRGDVAAPAAPAA